MVNAPQPAPRRKGPSVVKAMADGRNGGSVAPASNQGPPNKRGIQVGQFVLGKTLGEGTFGEVKLAVHTPTSERVAAKVLEKSRIKTIADVKRVSREIKILKRVRHPNVIALYEVMDTPSTIYFMMEHCDGGELFDYIVRHQRLEEGQACFFFRQLVDGIEYLHNHDVTHRDLKPENLLLQSSDGGWLLKIIDFGLSNTHEGGKLLQTACGSPCYAAPEMIAGERYRGPAADIWSCGVVLFTLVAGFLPFEDPNTSALYKKILSGSYEKPTWLSEGVIHLLSRILNTDPVKRGDISAIRQDEWYLGAHPPATQPKATPFPVVPCRRSHIDDTLLSLAITLAGGGDGGRPEDGGGGGGSDKGEASAVALEGAAVALLSGRHDPIGTAYYLLLKKSLREKSVIGAGGGGVGGGRGRRRNEAYHRHDNTTPRAAAAGAGAAQTSISSGDGDGKSRHSDREIGDGNSSAWRQWAEGMGQTGQSKPPAAAEAAEGGQQPLVTGASAPKAHGTSAPRVIHSNPSCASATSSSRSGQQLCSTARQRASSSMSSTLRPSQQHHVQVPLQSPAIVSRSILPAGPPTAGAPAPRPVTAAARAMQAAWRGGAEGAQYVVARKDGDGARVEVMVEKSAGNSAGWGVGSAEGYHVVGRAGQMAMPRRPVPKLSFRGISRTGGTENIVRGERTQGRPSSAAVFGSQTARTHGSGDARENQLGAPLDHPVRPQLRVGAADAHPRVGRRERSGSSSTTGSSSGGSAGGRSTIMAARGGTGTLPRRPLTARAPLRSSAPTPRLSSEFSLARPRGSPVSTGGAGARDTPSVGPSPRTATSVVSAGGSGQASLAAADAVAAGELSTVTAVAAREPPSQAPTGVVPTAAVAVATSPVLSVSTNRPTARQQPSLRVRLRNISSKPGAAHYQRPEPSGVAGGEGPAAGRGSGNSASMLATERKRDIGSSLRPAPRRPCMSSAFAGNSTAAALVPTGGSAAAREYLGKHGSTTLGVGGSHRGGDGDRGNGHALLPGAVTFRAPPHASTPAAKCC